MQIQVATASAIAGFMNDIWHVLESLLLFAEMLCCSSHDEQQQCPVWGSRGLLESAHCVL